MRNRFIALAVMCCFFSGCALNSTIPTSKLSRLTLNMTTEQVKSAVGEPFSTETFIDNRDNKPVLVWNYRTEYYIDIWGQGWENITPLVFKDNKLIGWGASFCQTIMNLSLNSGVSQKGTP